MAPARRGSMLEACEWGKVGVVVGGGAWPIVDVGRSRSGARASSVQTRGAAPESRPDECRPPGGKPPRNEAISPEGEPSRRGRGTRGTRGERGARRCLRHPHHHCEGNLVLRGWPSRRYRVDGERVAPSGVPPIPGRASERGPLAEVLELRGGGRSAVDHPLVRQRRARLARCPPTSLQDPGSVSDSRSTPKAQARGGSSAAKVYVPLPLPQASPVRVIA
jgi:hypothetical protein